MKLKEPNLSASGISPSFTPKNMTKAPNIHMAKKANAISTISENSREI